MRNDGGIENHLHLLGGLTSRADIAVFPVDCISHHAAHGEATVPPGGQCHGGPRVAPHRYIHLNITLYTITPLP
ncbi:MAG TPA: hypothetical protein VMU81_23095 [Acetobacteraceae bacterium]|nr:hypothetical protein [Acetobacteraceae bacterium]